MGESILPSVFQRFFVKTARACSKNLFFQRSVPYTRFRAVFKIGRRHDRAKSATRVFKMNVLTPADPENRFIRMKILHYEKFYLGHFSVSWNKSDPALVQIGKAGLFLSISKLAKYIEKIYNITKNIFEPSEPFRFCSASVKCAQMCRT
jgi:hypothetical protein